ncbi:MAG TPA: efflux RND transporter permease subunit, partial [Turneriella sp.]|nr:efflux RND transporter permease subunit [Turneriella sp.]
MERKSFRKRIADTNRDITEEITPPSQTKEKKKQAILIQGWIAALERGGVAAFSVKNPYLMLVICIMITILGGLAVFGMPKDLLPPSKQPAVQILSLYPGMATPNIETNLTYKFERYTGQAVGIERQESRSIPGVSVIKNFFDEKVNDQNSVMATTTGLIMSVLRRLPPGAQPPIILPFDPMGAVPLTLVTVSGDFPVNKIYDFAQYYVRRDIQTNPGAVAPTQIGGAEKQVILRLDPQKLQYYNMSASEVLDKVSRFNTFIPAGNVKIGKFDYQVYTNGIADTIDSFNAFPLRTQEGVHVYLRDVGQAIDSNIVQTNVVTVNGKEQVYVPVFRQQGANSLDVVERTRKAMKTLEGEIGVKLDLIADQTVFIKHAIDAVGHEALLGGCLAALMVFLFLGNPRAAGAVLLAIPLSALFTFMGLKVLGQTVNLMTLGGIALSIGLLVDNAIVAIDNIMRHLRENDHPNRVQVIVSAVHEVTGPIISITLCILVVLLPLLLTSGVINVLFGAIALTVMLAITGSLIAVATVIPLFASRYLSSASKVLPRILARIQEGLLKLSDAYARLLDKVMHRLGWVVGAVSVLLVGGILLTPFIGSELFPRADAGNLVVEARFQSGLRIEETKKKSIELENKIREFIDATDLKMVLANIGVYNGYSAAFTENSGTQDVTMTIELSENRKHTSQYYAKILRHKLPKLFPDMDLGIQLGGILTSALNGGSKAPIDIQIEGKDVLVSHKIAEEMLPKIKALRGAVDVRIQERFDAPGIEVNINRVKADERGIYADEIVQNVVSSSTGSITYRPSVWVDPKTGIDYFMGVRFPEREMSSRTAFGNIPITGQRQLRSITLKNLAEIKDINSITELSRVNMKRVINIWLDAEVRDVGSLSRAIQKQVINKTQFPE